MRNELLPGTNNVIRFPGGRPTLTIDTLRSAAPDCRDVLALATAFGIETPFLGLRDEADAQAARLIALHATQPDNRKAELLIDMEQNALRRALTGCQDAARADQALRTAGTVGGPLAEVAARITLQAHALCEEAEGIARAVFFARNGRAWFPRDHARETDELIALGKPLNK